VNHETAQDRVALVRSHEFVDVRLFAKVEMRGDGVLEEVPPSVETGLRQPQREEAGGAPAPLGTAPRYRD